MSVIPLRDSTLTTAGGKAATLALLARHGIAVPDGFVIPTEAFRRAIAGVDPDHAADPASIAGLFRRSGVISDLADGVGAALEALFGAPDRGHVAVRSSATNEDTAAASAAGQHDSFLAVRGTDAVCAAVLECWSSMWTRRAVAYRAAHSAGGGAAPEMAVLVQRLIEADVAGVLFAGAERVIEASWGFGDQLVSGQVTPDLWRISDGTIVERRLGAKAVRSERVADRLIHRAVPAAQQGVFCLTDAQVRAIDDAGREVTRVLNGPADIEWAISGGVLHVLQARPITAPVPGPAASGEAGDEGVTLRGSPASPGTATGTARVVHSPADFAAVRPGDVLVCRHTDPAWTPLFRMVSGVITETGGILSHAAIVAREVGIPAVLGVAGATTALEHSPVVTVMGATGRIHVARTEDAGSPPTRL